MTIEYSWYWKKNGKTENYYFLKQEKIKKKKIAGDVHATFVLIEKKLLNNFPIKFEIKYSKVCQCTNHNNNNAYSVFTLVIVALATRECYCHILVIVAYVSFVKNEKKKLCESVNGDVVHILTENKLRDVWLVSGAYNFVVTRLRKHHNNNYKFTPFLVELKNCWDWMFFVILICCLYFSHCV